MNNTRAINTYTGYKKQINGKVWSIVVVRGKSNYVNVQKETYGWSMGKMYDNFDKAYENYRCPKVRQFLLEVETGLIQPDEIVEG